MSIEDGTPNVVNDILITQSRKMRKDMQTLDDQISLMRVELEQQTVMQRKLQAQRRTVIEELRLRGVEIGDDDVMVVRSDTGEIGYAIPL